MNPVKSCWYILVAMLLAIGCFSCNEPPQKPVKVDNSQLKESLEKANRYLTNDEEEDIRNYMERHQLDMVSTGTGLRYQILQEGDGELIQPGQTVTMEYVLYNVMGDVVYSSENDGLMKLVVGCGDVVSGLDEAMRHLHHGDVAKVIIPSHLGYGLLGDQKSIPERSTLIYAVRILDVKW